MIVRKSSHIICPVCQRRMIPSFQRCDSLRKRGVKIRIPRTFPVQKRSEESGIPSGLTIPTATNPSVQMTALRSVPHGAPAAMRTMMSRTRLMELENPKTRTIRNHPMRDSSVLATDPNREKR